MMALLDVTNDTTRKLFRLSVDDKKYSRENGSVFFTNRELEILTYVSKGKTTKEIACYLMLSPHTINKHRENMLQKTGAKSMSEVISIAYLNGYLK